MDEKKKRYIDEVFRFHLAGKQERNEATKDWVRDKLASEIKPEGDSDGREDREGRTGDREVG